MSVEAVGGPSVRPFSHTRPPSPGARPMALRGSLGLFPRVDVGAPYRSLIEDEDHGRGSAPPKNEPWTVRPGRPGLVRVD